MSRSPARWLLLGSLLMSGSSVWHEASPESGPVDVGEQPALRTSADGDAPPGHPGYPALRAYAFTASGAEHLSTDGDGLYRDGGSRRGTATFTFPDVIPSTYGVYVRYRSSANRNPSGALFVVNGEEMRIDQVDASGEYFEVLFGDRRLGGTVTVVLDSSREAQSDSVTWIRLVPR